jgi:subtilisin
MSHARSTRPLLLFVLAGGLLALIAFSNASSIAAPAPPERAADFAIRLNALLEQAESGQPQPVLVTLAVATRPEGELSATQAQSQQNRIETAQQAVENRLAAATATIRHSYNTIPMMALTVDEAGLRALADAPEIVQIYPDQPTPPTLFESTEILGADVAWNLEATGVGQTVAVIDSGVDTDHSMFTGRVVSEACYSTTYAGYGSTSLCPDGSNAATTTGSGTHCSGISGCDHGTHVAGIAVGGSATTYFSGRNRTVSGVAPEANLIAIQVFSRFDGEDICGAGAAPCILSYQSDQIAGLERVYQLRDTYAIAAVNMSLGGSAYMSSCDSDPRTPIIDNLRSAGIATVVASGNEGYRNALSAPACISSAVSVGSTTTSLAGSVDQVSAFSNSATFLSLLAPGEYILSARPGNQFQAMAGTSMAAPHVAGAWALLKQVAPTASVDSILNSLQTTGISVTAVRTGFPNVTRPRIQVDDALVDLFPPPQSVTATGGTEQVQLNWQDDNPYEAGFVIERKPDGATLWSNLAQVPANTESYRDTGLTCNTGYSYRISGISSDGRYTTSTSEPARATTAACTSGTPTTTPTEEPEPNQTTQPTLYLNYTTGSPGSSFLLEGYRFTTGTTVQLRINGQIINPQISLDAAGHFSATLTTDAAAADGYYVIAVERISGTSTEASLTSYRLLQEGTDAIMRLRPPDAPEPIMVPATIPAYAQLPRLSLPLLHR